MMNDRRFNCCWVVAGLLVGILCCGLIAYADVDEVPVDSIGGIAETGPEESSGEVPAPAEPDLSVSVPEVPEVPRAVFTEDISDDSPGDELPASMAEDVRAVRELLEFIVYGLIPLATAVFVLYFGFRWFYRTFIDV